MKTLISGFVTGLIFGGAALAQPAPLSNAQMDAVVAGFHQVNISNTSMTTTEIFQRSYLLDATPNTISCSACYLLIVTPTFSVASQFGP
jgi:hypothetical protein